MGNYNAQYESYYSGILRKTRGNNRYSNASHSNNTFKLDRNYFIKRIMRELIGVFILFIFVLMCKLIKTPSTVAAYNYSKMMINVKYDYSQIITSIKGIKLSEIQSKSLEWMEEIRSKLTGGKTVKATVTQEFSLPVEGTIMSRFGDEIVSSSNEKIINNGIDFEVKEGTVVKASFDGRISDSGEDSKIGKYILIEHGNGVETKYGYLSEINVQKGDMVKKGEAIGKSGNSGMASSPKLHFELIYLGENKNVEEYFTLNN